MYLLTVDTNKSKYTIKEYSYAVHACSLQDIIGWPNTADFINYIEINMIPNCTVTKADIIQALDIFGTSIGSLQGKTTRNKHCILRTANRDTRMTWTSEPQGGYYVH